MRTADGQSSTGRAWFAIGLLIVLVAVVVFMLASGASIGDFQAAVAPLVAISAAAIGSLYFSGRAGNALDLEADKIRATVDSDAIQVVRDALLQSQGSLRKRVLPIDRQRTASGEAEAQSPPASESPARTSALDKQEAILREIYTQGLAQAKISFRVSIFFAAFGAILLFAGVGLAIWRAPSDGQDYASVVSLVAGVVINVVSSLFFVQSNHTRRDMAQQGALLREESQEDRRFSGARELVGTIYDDELRDQTTADIALQLMSAVGSPASSSNVGTVTAEPKSDAVNG